MEAIEGSRPARATGPYRDGREDGREDRGGAREDRPGDHGHGYALGFGFGLSLIIERNTTKPFSFLGLPSARKAIPANFAQTAFSEVRMAPVLCRAVFLCITGGPAPDVHKNTNNVPQPLL